MTTSVYTDTMRLPRLSVRRWTACCIAASATIVATAMCVQPAPAQSNSSLEASHKAASRTTHKTAHRTTRTQAKTPNHLQRGRELGAAAKWTEAEQELRTARAEHPDDVEAAALHAEALIKIAQPFDAALEAQSFLKTHPDALRMHQLYAVLAASTLHDPTLAGAELETCVRLDPTNFASWLSLGDLNMDQAKTGPAIDAYKHAVHLRPDDPVAVASLGHAYAGQSDSTQAEVEFQRALALSRRPNSTLYEDAVVHYLYGVFLTEQGKGQDAVSALTEALKFNPKSSDTFYWRARARQSLQQTTQAIADAEEAIRLSPGGKEAPLLLITLYRKAGDLPNAQKYADQTQKITDAEQQQASFGRGLRDTLDKAEPLLREGKFAEAIPLYESLLQKVPTFYEAWFALGTSYSETGRFAEGKSALEKYLSFQPVSEDGHAALGIVLAQMGDLVAARAELQRALDINPGSIDVRKVMAQVFLQQKQPANAAVVLQGARSDTDAELQALLAEALAQSGHAVSAKQAANRALVLDPQNVQAAAVRAELQAHRQEEKHP